MELLRLMISVDQLNMYSQKNPAFQLKLRICEYHQNSVYFSFFNYFASYLAVYFVNWPPTLVLIVVL